MLIDRLPNFHGVRNNLGKDAKEEDDDDMEARTVHAPSERQLLQLHLRLLLTKKGEDS